MVDRSGRLPQLWRHREHVAALRLGDHDRALATYGKAAQTHPKEASVWFELGMCHARHKEWEPALQSLRKAVGLDPENRQAVNALGFCLARAGRSEESLAIFKKAPGEDHPHTASSYNNLAGNLNDQGKYAEAEPLYRRALAIRKKTLLYHYGDNFDDKAWEKPISEFRGFAQGHVRYKLFM